MKYLIELQNLSFQTGGAGPAITVSAGLPAGSVLFISGPSGVGKTTLLRTISRLHGSISGEVYLDGQSWASYSVFQWRRLVHYFPQKPVLFSGTVRDNLTIPFTVARVSKDVVLNHDRAKRLLTLLLPGKSPEQDASTLSGGESSRLALIRALLIEPAVLLLDEPTAHLDRKTGTLVLQALAGWLNEQPRRGIIMVSHGNDAAQLVEMGASTDILNLGGRGKGAWDK
ncbi:ABC transporter ATP-binding protein [Desulfoscipio geothermicus]|uniref:Putative ABC transport system ATP-binding protein n=1 Tax=Desulfoscipio geothermicus DSM 3669 TaxID=1121426 RepID=A0A1I6DXU2_9FIRM|nr:ABC transporter ATP-binding protein [Desulfoscipio geothermicus]SFR10236.1 putative ABC transport system ATP-binding protein [Desulfoscipio geothermicus DSM 3669]